MNILALKSFCDEHKLSYKLNEPMKFHTSFKVGGEADIFISVSQISQLKALLSYLKESRIPYFIIGKGSNLVVSDKGIEGAVISLLEMNDISVEDDIINCQAGAALSSVCRRAMENSLTGLEFAYGIPGTVGGAVFMNAGAYGGEMADVLLSAECLTEDGDIVIVNAEGMKLGYRTSIFKTNKMIVLSARLKLLKGEKCEIEAKMEDFIGRRTDKQPLEYPSAGSFFKRPEGYFAGALVEKNGFKGFKIGGAMVSEKHAGFVINCGNATCEDIKALRDKITETVLENDGVKLETEVIFLGRN